MRRGRRAIPSGAARRGACALGSMLALAGCSSPSGTGGAGPAGAPADAPPPPPVTPIAQGLNVGVEAAVWRVEDDGALGRRLADTLGMAPEPPRISAADLLAWRDLGIRVVVVPGERLIEVFEAAPPVTGIDRDWVGATARWAVLHQPDPTPGEAARPSRHTATPVRPSDVALVARAWVAPGPDAALARLQLAVQVVDAFPEPERLSLETPTLPTALDRGALIDGSTISIALSPGQVALITYDRPEAPWTPSPDPDAPLASGTLEPERAGGERLSYGPSSTPDALPGELLFQRPATRGLPRATRDLIVLIPRFPPRFQLLP